MPPRFTPEQLDIAIDYVIEHGAVDRARTIRYTAVFEAASLPAPQDLHAGGEGDLVTTFMKAFHDRCVERDLPPLDSIVVHVAGPREGRPGKGYFTVNNQADPFSEKATAEAVVTATNFWENQQGVVRAWGTRHRKGHI